MLKVGDRLPGGTLHEYIEVPSEGCSVGPQPVELAAALKGKTIAVFAVPGAFTPTCSSQHLPGYLAAVPDFKALGVNEVWCLAVNDAFVMGAWGRAHQVEGRVRMLADGSGDFTRAIGLTLDLAKAGLGLRSLRYSALVVDGVVSLLNVEEGGALAVSDAQTLLKQIKAKG